MATAVIRIAVDPHRRLDSDQYERGIQNLRANGLEVIAGQPQSHSGLRHEIEVIVEDHGRELPTSTLLAQCRSTFHTEPELGVVTYISRGTEEDARGVLARFGITGDVLRHIENGEEIFTISIAAAAPRHVPEASLHTALEAALNAEVRFA